MNRLAREKSPYLLQHARNPVDWYPWGEEAFAEARRRNCPIFLSIGYSTCHWCHVMEHESFEDRDIAEVLNREFVPIKVDREERPDIDRVYMTFVQATTGSGGWPMSVWLTPGLQPFYGGTYFPPSSRWGQPGLLEILREIARFWREQREQILRSAESLTFTLRRQAEARRGPGLPGPELLPRAVASWVQVFDGRRGGFGSAPKFPRPSELLFLCREHARTGDADARRMVLTTLDAMTAGGMRDHIGGGFHRYSVDADWRIPHFEKMLYDQAQLVLAYLEAAQLTGNPSYLDTAEDTLAYVLRDLRDPGGAFYSAEDADSIPPERAGEAGAAKREGAFYLWTDEEVGRLLGPSADFARIRFGIRPQGNAPADPHGDFAGKNHLFLARSLEEVASATAVTVEQVRDALAEARRILLERRSSRPRPHLDDKILTAWNGLMIAALARAARVAAGREGAREYLHAAQRAARFLRSRLWDEDRRVLRRRYRDGEAAIDGYAEDYAYLIWGLLELFQASGDPRWVDWAVELQARQDALFWDEAGGGWFSTSGADPSVLMRIKDDYDGAEPTPSAVGAMNVQVLHQLTGGGAWLEKAERTVAAFEVQLREVPRAVPMMLAALSAFHAGRLRQIVIAGEPDAPDTAAMLAAVARHYLPFTVVTPVGAATHGVLAARLPMLEGMRPRDGRATAYVCEHFSCRQPTTDVEELVAMLGAAPATNL